MRFDPVFFRYSFMAVLGLGLTTTSAQAITITPTNDGNALVNSILGAGITVDMDSVNYLGADNASGFFTDGGVIGIDSGIILTTGNASSAVGPNLADNTTTDNGFSGDADLDSLIPGFVTQDATILEFDFESEGGDLFFKYVFASEEYNEFVNSSFNDVFGFFLNGEDIGLIPGTTTPVAINNVNNGINSDFYNDNDPSDTSTPFDIEYDGFTTVFTAQALNIPAGTNTIKLAIADAGDSILDSAVFIQAGSFTDDPEPVPEPSSLLALMSLFSLGVSSAIKREK